MRKISESDRTDMAQRLFASSDWQLIPALLHDIEQETIYSLRTGGDDIQANVLTLRLITNLQSRIRLIADNAGVTGDPFDGYC